VRVGEAGPARIYAIRGDVRRLAVASRAAGTVDVRSWIELRRGGRRTLDRRRAGIVTWGASVVALSRRSIRRIKHAPARARVAFRITVRTGSGAPRRTTVRLKLRR
jgi:hypothetical protein